MSDDTFAQLLALSVSTAVVLVPTAALVWLILRALQRSRRRDQQHPAVRGFEVLGQRDR